MMRPSMAAGVGAVLPLIALTATGRAITGLASSNISSSGLRQADRIPTRTPEPELKVSPGSVFHNQTVTLTGTNFNDSFTSGGAGTAGCTK